MSEIKTNRLSLRIPEQQHKKLKIIADIKNISVNEYLNILIKNELAGIDLKELVKDIE